MLGPSDVGHRVVVRRNAGFRDNRPIYTDLLGKLTQLDETQLTVETRRGVVDIPISEIARAKRVPDQRRLTGTEAVEIAAAHGWPAGEQARLGDWLLRATDGWTRRGNSVLPIGDPGMPLPEAIDTIIHWYRERGLPPVFFLPMPLRAGLDAELDRRGWRLESVTTVMTAGLDELTLDRRPEPVRLDTVPSPEWLAVAARRKHSLPDVALHVLTGPDEVRFGTVHGADGAVLATARGTVADPERRWLGLSLVETADAVRRRGYARHIIGALVDWARDVGATDAYLQVLSNNEPARALYRRIGFSDHHTYVARILDPS